MVSLIFEVLVDPIDTLAGRLKNQFNIRRRALDLKSRYRGDYIQNMSNMKFSGVRKRFETVRNLRQGEFSPLADRFDVRLPQIIWRDAAVEDKNLFHRRVAIEIVERSPIGNLTRPSELREIGRNDCMQILSLRAHDHQQTIQD